MHQFPAEWKQGLYEAVYRRRDMREFLPDAVSGEVVARILDAGHHGPSVGFMQPWNFLVVEDRALRQRIFDHVNEERLKAADAYEGDKRERYLSLKLEGILDAPLNVCVTCDTRRRDPAVLGRQTIRETDVYSTCCAIQNMWLAARAEGVGMGWVSILEPEALHRFLNIPAHILPVAYLCMGYVPSFPDKPGLERAGWETRDTLASKVFGNRWNDPAPEALAACIANSSATAPPITQPGGPGS